MEETGIPDPAAPPPLARADATLTVLVCLLVGMLPLLEPPHGFILITLGTAAAFYRQCIPALHVGIVGSVVAVLTMVPVLRAVWPVPLLAGIALDALVTAVAVSLRDTAPWWRVGRLGGVEIALGAAFAALAGAFLFSWQILFDPDLSDLVLRIPNLSWPWLLAIGVLFASTNALAEEVYFRGTILHSLECVFGRGATSLALQAVIFGMVHFEGFPRGVVGVVLASVYGGMMGVIRRRSDGLAVVWASHLAADLVIFGVVVRLALMGAR